MRSAANSSRRPNNSRGFGELNPREHGLSGQAQLRMHDDAILEFALPRVKLTRKRPTPISASG
jgi:hypothetical protein